MRNSERKKHGNEGYNVREKTTKNFPPKFVGRHMNTCVIV